MIKFKTVVKNLNLKSLKFKKILIAYKGTRHRSSVDLF
jgi:hypothetical protein